MICVTSVEFRSAQTCCGQMHYNTGYQRRSPRYLCCEFLKVFLRRGSHMHSFGSSCVAMIRDHYPKMAAETSVDPEVIAEVTGLFATDL